jgi:hypothetical protein
VFGQGLPTTLCKDVHSTTALSPWKPLIRSRFHVVDSPLRGSADFAEHAAQLVRRSRASRFLRARFWVHSRSISASRSRSPAPRSATRDWEAGAVIHSRPLPSLRERFASGLVAGPPGIEDRVDVVGSLSTQRRIIRGGSLVGTTAEGDLPQSVNRCPSSSVHEVTHRRTGATAQGRGHDR